MSTTGRMVTLAQKYLDYRHQLGFQLHVEGGQVLAFARYADASRHQGAITTELALRWACLPPTASPLYQARRLEVVRCFARYAAIFDESTQIPGDRLLGQAHRRTTPHIYTTKEIGQLMKASAKLSPINGLRPRTYHTLFGLLASTGLRIAEALRLARGDLDLSRGLVTVSETKFHKSRLIVLHRTTCVRLRIYERFRDRYHPIPSADTFFLTEQGKALNYSTVRTTFRGIATHLGWEAAGGRSRPRIYDLRHTFASRRLLQWYREGVDIDHAMAALSTYMGHENVTATYWYLTGIPELLRIAANRFEHFTQSTFQENR